MTSKFHRELMRRLQEAGITINGYEQRSSSIALDCSKNGRTHRYYLGLTPSDWRAMDNAFHDIKRALVAPAKEASHAHAN